MFDILRMSQTENSSGDNGGSLELLREVMSLAAHLRLRRLNASRLPSLLILWHWGNPFWTSLCTRILGRSWGVLSLPQRNYIFGPITECLKDILSALNGERFMFKKPTKQSGSSLPAKRWATGYTSAPKRKVTVAPRTSYELQWPQSMATTSTSGLNFHRPGKSKSRGFQKRRGGYS